jgi:hypothetical protein
VEIILFSDCYEGGGGVCEHWEVSIGLRKGGGFGIRRGDGGGYGQRWEGKVGCGEGLGDKGNGRVLGVGMCGGKMLGGEY